MNVPNVQKFFRISSIVDAPSPIESLFYLSEYDLLAVGRNDNSIEVWSTKTWVQLAKIYGNKNIQIRRVFLIKKKPGKNLFDGLRVFSTGLNGYLVEWSLVTLQQTNYYNSPGGCIWDCDLSNDRKLCALAGDDGSVRIIRLKESGFYLVKQFVKPDSKLLSVKWSNSNKFLYAGSSDGTISKWEYSSPQPIANFIAGVKKGEQLLVWALEISADDKFLFSGDSKGLLRVWDTKFAVVRKEYKEHEADILSICYNKERSAVYFTGSDSLVAAVQFSDEEWVLTSKFRAQSHDVNSLILLNQEQLLSGGLTTDICIYTLHNGKFPEKYERKSNTSMKRHISAFEQKQKVYISSAQGSEVLILHRKLDSLCLYSAELHSEEVTFLAEVNKKNDSNIISANISNDGSYFAYSDADNTVIFSYQKENNDIKKVKTMKNLSSRYLYFSPDETQLISVSNAEKNLSIYDIKTEIRQQIQLPEIDHVLSSAISANGRKLALSTTDKDLCLVDITARTASKSLPCPSDFITCLHFVTNTELCAVAEDNKFYLIDTDKRKLTNWTNENLRKFPRNYLSWYNKIYGVTSESSDQLLLFTDYNYIPVDLRQSIPQNSTIERKKSEKLQHATWERRVKEFHKQIFAKEYRSLLNTKTYSDVFGEASEKGREVEENSNFRIVSRFSSILHMAYQAGRLLVVENDWEKIVQEFPEAVARLKYGN